MTTATTIEVFQKAAESGLKLGFEPPDTLTLQPASRCSAEFTDTLRAYKSQLLALLQLPFSMAYSNVLKETIFLAEDEDAKAALVQAGADPWSIYTRDELFILVALNRAKPFIPDELCKLRETRRTFSGRITK
jgi:hypothetical protein